jgi:5'-nucleotidase
LNAGDNFQGTLWYTLLRWNVTQYMLNLVPADAMTIGNHEFDNGVIGLVPFLKTIQSPILVANLDVSEEPTIETSLFRKSMILERGGQKIGVIGVIIKTTPELSVTEKVRFLDEEETVRAEAAALKAQGASIIIVLSHCGLIVDKRLARNLGSDIDVIVGGHSHTLLYNGTNVPGPDEAGDTYPVVVEQTGGHKTLIVQASAYSKYLGDITVYFDGNGEAQEWEGNTIFMAHDVPQDPDILRELVPWRQQVDAIGEARIGTSKVYLETRTECARGECNFGSLLCDAFVDYVSMI